MPDQLPTESDLNSLVVETRHFINGRYEPSVDAAVFQRKRPMDGQPGPTISRGSTHDINAAVCAARAVFESGEWRDSDPAERKVVMLRFAALIRENAAELALLETLDTGRPIAAALSVDVASAANSIAWYGEVADKQYDEIAPSGPEDVAMIRRMALGVVGVITPWNYPLIISAWKLGPALAMGNSVVHKPAEQSSLSALRLASLGKEAGLPDGVFNVVAGFGEEAGDALASHKDVDLIAFTGSTDVGQLIMVKAAKSNLKRVALELGGKSPMIVFDDADLDKAATAAAWGFAYHAGQTCHAPTRLICHASKVEDLCERIRKVLESIPTGIPFDSNAQVGAVIDDVQLSRILGFVERAQADGGNLLFGGQRILEETGGYYLSPGVVVTNNKSEIAQDEVFGPILAVIPFDTEDEALAMANDSRYGLAAAVFTENMSRANRMSSGIRAGTVWINTYDKANMTTPFGGFKQSGFGRDRSVHALDKYADLKTVWQNFGG